MKKWNVLTKLINKNNFKTVVEIGTARGINTKNILQKNKNKELVIYTIDPYEVNSTFSFTHQSENESYAKNNLYSEIIKGRCKMFKACSDIAAKIFEPKSVDLVFINCDNSCKYIEQNFLDYLPLVRTGGILSGNNYKENSEIMEVVDRCVKKSNLDLITEYKNDDWFWYVKK